ncbi:hypothetical protein BDZ89DRAFT_1141022 [Hymenopellis radicata]|nr:hypothetical protein BDZ89DRAFT_1141022 [Hymenopellis radicata]
MSSTKSEHSFFIVLTDSEDEDDGSPVSMIPPTTPSRRDSSKSTSTPRADSSDDDELFAAFSNLSVGPPDSGKLYSVQKDGNTQVTTHWADAGYEQQHHGAQVVALTPKKNKARTAAGAYVVFAGRQTGVLRTWAECNAATSRFSGAIFQGYLTRDFAAAAFQHALQARLVRNGLTAARTYRKIRVRNATLTVRSDDGPLSLGVTHKAWYNVYAGTQPGIYASYVEAAFHYVGIPNSHHDSYPSYGQAPRD